MGEPIVPLLQQSYRTAPHARLRVVAVFCRMGPAGRRALLEVGEDSVVELAMRELHWRGQFVGETVVRCLGEPLRKRAVADLEAPAAPLDPTAARVVEIVDTPTTRSAAVVGLRKALDWSRPSAPDAHRPLIVAASRTSGAEVTALLVSALRDRAEGAANAAHEALAARPDAVGALRAALERAPKDATRNPWRVELILALAEQGPAGVAVLRAAGGVEAAVEALAKSAEESMPGARGFPADRRRVPMLQRALPPLANEAREAALRLLSEGRGDEQRKGVRLLYFLADRSTAPALRECLDTCPFWLQGEAAMALARAGGSAALDDLLDVMQARDLETSALGRRAVVSLGQSAVPELERRLEGDPAKAGDPTDRQRCVADVLTSLGEPGLDVLRRHHQTATSALIAAFWKRGHQVEGGGDLLVAVRRLAPQAAIDSIRASFAGQFEHAPLLLVALADVPVDPAWNVPPLDMGPLVPKMIAAFDRAEIPARLAAALGVTRDPRAYDCLVRALQHRHDVVREAAARALGRFGDPRAARLLVRIVESSHEDSTVRSAAQEGLERLGDVEALDAVAWYRGGIGPVWRLLPPQLYGSALLLALGAVVVARSEARNWALPPPGFVLWSYRIAAVFAGWRLSTILWWAIVTSMSRPRAPVFAVFGAYLVCCLLTGGLAQAAARRSRSVAAGEVTWQMLVEKDLANGIVLHLAAFGIGLALPPLGLGFMGLMLRVG